MTSTRETRKWSWVQWVAMLLLFIAAYAWMTRGTASPFIGEPAPPLSLPVAAGGDVDTPPRVVLGEMRDRVVVLEFWASWCSACRRATPILNALHEELAPRGVAFYAVNVEPIDRQRVQAAHAAFGTEFPTLHDRAGEVQRRYAIRVLPTVVLIDRRGMVRWASTGIPSKMRLRAAISEALE